MNQKYKLLKYRGVVISGVVIGFLTYLESKFDLVKIIIDFCTR